MSSGIWLRSSFAAWRFFSPRPLVLDSLLALRVHSNQGLEIADRMKLQTTTLRT